MRVLGLGTRSELLVHPMEYWREGLDYDEEGA